LNSPASRRHGGLRVITLLKAAARHRHDARLELALREERLRKLAEARAKIEARAKERYARELAEHEAKLAARADTAPAEARTRTPSWATRSSSLSD
jgi:putative hemolysin